MARPKLRFQEFTDEWENNGLDQLVHFSKGAILSKADIDELGEIPCILYGQLYTKYGEIADVIFSRTNCNKEELVYSEEKDVIMPISGETPEDISTATCIMKSGIALGGDLLILRSNMLDGRFLSYYLNYPLKYRIAGIAQGKSIVHIGERSLKTLNMCYPTLGEQRKIIDFLSSVQDIIQVQEEEIIALEEQKKGVMQKLFNRGVRFKVDDGNEYPEWEKKSIGKILKICHGKDYKHLSDGNIPVLGTGGTIKFVNEYLCDWECVLIGRKGTIDKPQYMNAPFWCVDTLFYSRPEKNQCVKFQYYLFQTINWKVYDESTGIPSLSASIIEKISVLIPCFEEQKKIADCLSTYDEAIQIKRDKMEIWKEIKKGLLQQMFI